MRRRASAEAICNSRWLFHLTVDLWRSPPGMSNDAVDASMSANIPAPRWEGKATTSYVTSFRLILQKGTPH